MNENLVNLIKSIVYYELATTEKQTSKNAIKKFEIAGKEYFDDIMHCIPEGHPARLNYEKLKNITSDEFSNLQQIVFTKMSMYEISTKIADWDFIASDEDVDKFAEKISEFDVENVEKFIEDNKSLLNSQKEKYEFYFSTLYKYLSRFYENASSKYHDDEKYDLAEKNYKKLNDLLIEYMEINNEYDVLSRYATNLYNLGYLYNDIQRYDEAEQKINQCIDVRKHMLEQYPNNEKKIVKSLAMCYSELGYIYKKRYKESKDKNLKEKCLNLFNKSIELRLKLETMEEDYRAKVKIYNKIAWIYYQIFDDENAEKTYKKAIELCEKKGDIELLKKEQDELKQYYEDRAKYKDDVC